MSRFGDLDVTTVLVFVFVIMGSWTMMGWTTRALGVDAWTRTGTPLRILMSLVIVSAIAWAMTSWAAAVAVVVGAGAVMDWLGGIMRRLLREATSTPHRPRLFAGECACTRYDYLEADLRSASAGRDAWANHFVEHRSDCPTARSTQH